MILNKTQLDKDLELIDIQAERVSMTVSNAITLLNQNYDSFWNLPEERLLNVLQYLLDNGKLEEVFTRHYITGTALNSISELLKWDLRSKVIAGRKFEIIDEKIVLEAIPTEPDVIDIELPI